MQIRVTKETIKAVVKKIDPVLESKRQAIFYALLRFAIRVALERDFLIHFVDYSKRDRHERFRELCQLCGVISWDGAFPDVKTN